MSSTPIVWLRRDLRLADNPALAAAWSPGENGAWQQLDRFLYVHWATIPRGAIAWTAPPPPGPRRIRTSAKSDPGSFRIFNPVLQGERFDPDGPCVRRWVPELAGLPNRVIHRPWDAAPESFAVAGVKGGNDYPPPVVDLERSRNQVLERYADWKHWSEIAD